MPDYYKGVDHTNTTDDEEDVVSITSTEVEKKKVVEVGIVKETNAGELKFYVERENLFEGNTYHKTAQATLQNALVYSIDREIPVGQTFKLTLKNVTAGTNAALVGYVKYQIL